MTKYSVSVLLWDEWEGFALFSDKVSLESIVQFCIKEFEHNDRIILGDNIAITDMETGEILWDYNSDYRFPDSLPLDPDDPDCGFFFDEADMGFDPYLGCYTDDC